MKHDRKISIGIQKRDGHMFEASAKALSAWWDIAIPAEADIKGRALADVVISYDDVARMPAKLLMCRIEDVAADLHTGIIDFGIVTTDVLSEWEAAKGLSLRKKAGIQIKDIGPAGSRLMIGVAESFLNQDSAQPVTWQDAVRYSFENQIPIFTSFEKDFKKFLAEEGFSVPERDEASDMEPIEKRRGTIEAQALLAGAKVIVDLVEKGNTMRALGYEPIKQIDESRTLAIGRIRPEDPRNRVLQAMFDRIPGPLLVA